MSKKNFINFIVSYFLFKISIASENCGISETQFNDLKENSSKNLEKIENFPWFNLNNLK